MSRHAPPPQTDPDRLHGWKEISAFVGKGVRTVQRWEKQYGLPVRRLRDGSEIVFASKKELEAWMLASSSQTSADTGADGGIDDVPGTVTSTEPTAGVDERTVEAVAEVAAAASSSTIDEDSPQPGASIGASTSPHVGLTTPGGGTTQARGWRTWVFGIIAVSLVGVVAIGVRILSGNQASFSRLSRGATTPRPDSWDVAGRFLRVSDQHGRPLWSKEFDEELLQSSYRQESGNRLVLATDLDGDGSTEILFLVHRAPSYPYRTELVVFNSDGGERFHYSTAPTVRFGQETFVPPWIAHRVHVTTDGAGRKAVWVVSIHSPWYPSVVQRLDPLSGAPLSTYWSAGYIGGVWRITWRGQPVTAVGATNNDLKAATLALFPADEVNGTSPAARDDYRCADCQAGTPMEFLVFPRSCLWSLTGGHPTVTSLGTDSTGALRVGVDQSPPLPNSTMVNIGALLYTLDSDLRIQSIGTTQQFDAEHARARQLRHVDHDFGPADDRWLLPLLRWDGSKFMPLERAPAR